MTCYCGETNGTHKLHCDSMTDDGLCVVPWCKQRWDHAGPCDDVNGSGDPDGFRFLSGSVPSSARKEGEAHE